MPQRSSRGSTGTITGTVTVSAYPRTNSLIVTSSSARNFELVKALIDDLDGETPADFKRKTLIYPLEYSDAEEMEDLLNSMFSEDGSSASSRQRQSRSFFRMMMGGSTTMLKDMTTLAGQVQVNSDAQTNTLIFTTPERNFPAIMDIVKQLDIVRGQVWLEITVFEAMLSDDNKLGLEWSWSEGNHLGQKDWTGEFGTSFHLGSEGLGFSYKIFNNNLTAILHTLMRENRVKVLSSTSLPTRDNQTATLSKGKDIPYLESTRTDNYGNVMYDYAFLEDIGINIEITPHIAKSGLRGLKVALFNLDGEFLSELGSCTISEALRQAFKKNGVELSDAAVVSIMAIGDEWTITDADKTYIARKNEDAIGVYLKERRTVGLDIANMNVSNFVEYTDFNAPITADSSITTYVDVGDGESIVIGGMMRSEEKLVTHQIPILGSIPFLGRLFKKTEKTMEDTELLILITPHIIDINNPEDIEMLGKLERATVGDNKEIKWTPPGTELQPAEQK